MMTKLIISILMMLPGSISILVVITLRIIRYFSENPSGRSISIIELIIGLLFIGGFILFWTHIFKYNERIE